MPDRVVWKYTQRVAEVMTLVLPEGAELLHVADQEGHGRLVDFWALVDPGSEGSRERAVQILATGHPVSDPLDGLGHWATIITAGGALVWHVFLDFDGALSIPEGR